jgi:hypothetical protein
MVGKPSGPLAVATTIPSDPTATSNRTVPFWRYHITHPGRAPGAIDLSTAERPGVSAGFSDAAMMNV